MLSTSLLIKNFNINGSSNFGTHLSIIDARCKDTAPEGRLFQFLFNQWR